MYAGLRAFVCLRRMNIEDPKVTIRYRLATKSYVAEPGGSRRLLYGL